MAVASAIHGRTTLGFRHPVHNYDYADAAARTAATGFAADDVGKVARQLDDNSFWLLTDESPITWVQIDIGTEVAAARAPFATLAAHVNNNTQLAAGSFFPAPIVGEYFDNSTYGAGHTSRVGAPDRLELGPLTVCKRTRIDEIGLFVTTGVGAATSKMLLYNSDADGWPDTLLYESTDLANDTSSTYAFASVNIILEPGIIYWVGARFNSTQDVRVLATGGCRQLGMISASTNQLLTILRRTASVYGDPAPDPFVFVAGDRASNAGPPSVRMRVAAL